MAEGRRCWRNGAVSAWRGTSHHGPSTTIRHASGTAAGRSWCNGSWPRLAIYADQGTRSRCITFVPSKISTPRGRNTNPNGSRGWLPAAARPSSSAASATRTSTPDVQHADHDEHRRASCYGKRARLVRRGAVGKGPGQLAPRRRPTLPHGGFGRRHGETHQWKHRQGAPGRPHHAILAKLGIPVTCTDIFGVWGSTWLDGLELPQPYA